MIDVLFVHEVLKRNNIKLNNERKKNVNQRGRIKVSSLRYCCVLQVMIPEE